MKKYKRTFEDYKELALNLRTTRELLLWTTHIYKKASYSNEIIKMCNKLDKLISKAEDEMFMDYPDRANTNVFYGGDVYKLDIRKHRDYIYSSFSGSSCEQVDAFAILTRQGIVLLSDDAKVTSIEDSYLYELNQKLIQRKEQNNENSNPRQNCSNRASS